MKSIHHNYFPVLTFSLGLAIWVIDAFIDVFILHGDDNESFIEGLFFVEASELWMRTLIVLVLTAIGFYAKSIIHQQKLVEQELLAHKHNLEDLVQSRVNDINEKNIQLEEEIENRKLAEIELERLATTDPLTTLYNRRKIQSQLEYEIKRVKRYKTPLSIIILDIDHFKTINDHHGHNKGDEVLINISRILFSHVRSTDMVARWGGEEFLIVSVSSTAKETYQLADKLRKLIEQTHFDGINNITASAGIAEYSKDMSLADYINQADKALYLAKSKGRNRVEIN